MARLLFLGALVAIPFTTGALSADDPPATPKQLQFSVRVLEGDPLGDRNADTLRVLADTRIATLENRPMSLAMGGELPVNRDGNIELIRTGRTLECRPSAVRNGK